MLDLDKLIEVNKMQEVSSPRLFSNKMMYDPEGILSNGIFGISKNDRRTTFAYIDLHQKFIHPHIYQKVLKSLFKDIGLLMSGQRKYSVQDGLLTKDEKGWTGLTQLYKHWDEIDWSKKKSENITNKKLLMNLRKDQVFIDKMIVCPPAYRDVLIAGTVDSSDHVNELNDLYTKLIRMVALMGENGLFARTQFATQMKVQELLVEISDYFKGKIKSKNGLIRKYLLGKTVDYGVRAVISAPSYKHENISDNIIDSEHTAIPIAMCCSTFYPFIETWLRTYFTREIVNNPNLISYVDPKTKKEFTALINKPDVQFNDKNIRKMINDFALNPDNRFKPLVLEVIVPGKDQDTKKVAYLLLKGKEILPGGATRPLNRVLTIADLLYIACVDVCEKRHVMISRYPVGTDKGIYFNKIRVSSTLNHINVTFNGKEYPFYPDIDLNIDQSKVGIQFIDTVVMSNSHLDGMGELSALM